jgi:hypothetical protein
LTWIEAEAEKSRPVTRTELRHYCEAKYAQFVSKGWVDSFILRHAADLTERKSTPQEEARLEVPHVFLEETIRCLRDRAQGMKAELVFNLDEVGISEWEDRKEKKVIVPKTMDGQTIHHRVSRNVKHISIITCISAGGESLTPYIVMLQDSERLRKRLMARGVRLGVDFVLTHRPKPYINGKLFLDYITHIFVPYLNELRESEEFAECEAILLMDNCSPHMGDAVIALLTREHVRVITFAPHTTHIFQVLDLVLFGALKKHSTRLSTLDEEQPAAAFIIKVYHDFKQTMIEVNIWGAFSAIGFSHDISREPYELLFDEEKFRQSRGFLELWERDVLVDSLSRGRQQARFSWINQ